MKLSALFPDGGRVSLEAEGNLVTIRGEIDQTTPKTFLSPFIDEVHAAAEQEGLRDVKVDLRNLLFHNSSAFKELIAWVLRRHRMPAGKKYSLEFIYDSGILCQRTTIPTLKQLDPEFIVLSDRNMGQAQVR
jgi:hypothetical protein